MGDSLTVEVSMDETTANSSSTTMIKPSYISLPPRTSNPNFLFYTDTMDSPGMFSPALTFHTAPSSPSNMPKTPSPQPSPSISQSLSASSPPSLPNSTMLHISISQSSPTQPHPAQTPPSSFPSAPHHSPSPHFPSEPLLPPAPDPNLIAEDSFPDVADLPVDIALESEGLSTLERIYLFSQSKASYHRFYIVNALPDLLEQVTPHEAIEYVLPLLNSLAMDEDDTIKEAFSLKLVTIIWWFFTHCQVVPGDDADIDPGGNPSPTAQGNLPTISVQAFTPILGTLLLNPNSTDVDVSGAARNAIVALLGRIKTANEIELGNASDSDVQDLVIGHFGKQERALFEREILYQVVIGMGRLDVEETGFHDAEYNHSPWRQQPINNLVNGSHNAGSDLEPSVQVIVSVDNGLGGIRFSGPEDDSISKSPQHSAPKKLEDSYNPYFPPIPPTRSASERTDSPASIASSGSSNSTPGSTTGTSASSEDDIYLSPLPSSSDLSPNSLRSQSPRRSPTLSSSSRFTHDLSPPYRSPLTSPLPSTISEQQQSTSSPTITHNNSDTTTGLEEEAGGQAAVGRLSSMSLMAAVAASGCLDDSTKQAFVREVERVSQDPVYWVRREACFALGALAKVVPEEVVHLSLIPLLQNLVSDPIYHVRHSSLFALPAILSRLPYKTRKKLALDVTVPMSMDESADVRGGVLEALGEIIYTFHNDSEDKLQPPFNDVTVESPPEELLGMFLGRTQDRRIIDGQQPGDNRGPPGAAANRRKALDAFFTDLSRPLICAFNFPAVALTLGRSKWPLLRETYLSLAQQNTIHMNHSAIQRILAASLGDLAKIIGPENAERDLIPVWWNVVKNDEDHIRMKAVECLSTFISALGKEGQMEVLTSTLQTWESGAFKGWREREVIARSLYDIMGVVGQEAWNVVVELETISLLDSVNAVREAGIYALPKLWSIFRIQSDASSALSASLTALAQSASSRKRMTFIACQQALVVPESEAAVPTDDAFCERVAPLAVDDVLGVRIGVARLIGTLYILISRRSKPIPPALRALATRLAQDPSSEVRAYVEHLESPIGLIREHNPRSVSTFSRPPPSHVTPSSKAIIGALGQ